MAGRAQHTKERILKTALALFNEEGEQNVGLVEVAGEMGISPGNLYYHYKGKEPLLTSLYDAFEEEILTVLAAPADKPLNLEDNWVYLYIIFEELFDFRFFFLNQASILDRVPALKPKISHLTTAMAGAMEAVIDQLMREGLMYPTGEQQRLIARRSALLFTYWLPHCAITMPDAPVRHIIHEGVYTIFSQLTPYLGDGAEEFERLLKAFHDRMMDKG